MNDETILALGSPTKELLGSEFFQALIQLYSQQCAFDVLNTEPQEVKRREGIYAAYQGFEGFLGLAKKLVAAYDKLLAEENQVVDELDEIDDPSVHDIYDGRN